MHGDISAARERVRAHYVIRSHNAEPTIKWWDKTMGCKEKQQNLFVPVHAVMADYNGLYFIVWQSTDRHNSRTNTDCAPSHLTQANVQRWGIISGRCSLLCTAAASGARASVAIVKRICHVTNELSVNSKERLNGMQAPTGNLFSFRADSLNGNGSFMFQLGPTPLPAVSSLTFLCIKYSGAAGSVGRSLCSFGYLEIYTFSPLVFYIRTTACQKLIFGIVTHAAGQAAAAVSLLCWYYYSRVYL